MGQKLKLLNEQVIVITGASSGIGLATAKLAARRGAQVVLVSRDEEDLARAVREIQERGASAVHFVADVADQAAMQRVARDVVVQFGRIDTWINNAGVTVYGLIEEVPTEDARRLFETNYWGVVNGSLAALPHLRSGGGALINLGSVLSDTGYPLQGHYTASKHAVKGFTDSLRLEVEKSGAPVCITLIQPAAIDTPYPEHAKNHLGFEAKHMPPVYAPEVVAKAILHCAERPERNVLVGGSGKVFSTSEKFAPRLFDRMKEATSFHGQLTDRPARSGDTLFHPRPDDGRVRGGHPGHVMKTSAYTEARLHRGKALLGLAVLGAGLFVAKRARH
ncbi:MAG TPA: SDR family oxidoreductase [Gemmatimonadales bacterium]|jgi:NAD(P)-dependent dehydrogenase (short-subunit alcohol dehydrogenase family)|nr:SDR family oxidoreductase [Gemmatimonadales bacterium]